MAIQRRRETQAVAGTDKGRAEIRLHEPGTMKKIAEAAYYLWEKRGRPHGNDMQDWIEAEKAVLGRKI
jgi:hypothetical protein